MGAMLWVLTFPLAAQAPDWTHTTALPVPTGPYAVGVATIRLVDSTRPTSRHLAVRPLTVQVWYPAMRNGRPGAPYLSEAGLLDSMIQSKYLDLSEAELRGLGEVRVSVYPDGRPVASPTPRGWPVILFSHGLGVARAGYSALSQELASRGYVVLTVDHPLGGFTLGPDGRVLTPGADSVPLSYQGHPYRSAVGDWALDAGLVIRALARGTPLPASLVLDTSRVGMLGHSLGGAAALEACRISDLFRACTDMDGAPFGEVETRGVGKPFLILLSEPDHDGRPPARDTAEAAERERFAQMGRERDSSWAAICARDSRYPCFPVKLKGTGHFSFSDAPFLTPALLRGVGATLSPARQHAAVSAKVLEFFDHYLGGRPLRSLRAYTSPTARSGAPFRPQ